MPPPKRPAVIRPPSKAKPLADIEAAIAMLEQHLAREPSARLRGAYTAAIDRLTALVYWLRQAAPVEPPAPPAQPPAPAPEPEPAAPASKRPASRIVVSRKPKR